MMKHATFLKLGGTFALTGLALAFSATAVMAADHAEAPGAAADAPADIADFFAWHTDDDSVVAIVTFAGLTEAGSPATYDPDVLYGIHIDNDGDDIADIDVWMRFGQNAAGEWGLQVINLPGADAPVIGAVEAILDGGNGTRAYAGLRDDPFFFDLDGYIETLDTGTLSFDSSNDSFADTNTTAIVIEMDAALASGGSDTFQMWATTGRE